MIYKSVMDLVLEKVNEAIKQDKFDFVGRELFFGSLNLSSLIDHSNFDHKAFEDIVKSVPVIQWYDSDSYCGLEAILLNKELVCLSWKTGRKDYEDYSWVSKETFEKSFNEMFKLCNPSHNLSLFEDNDQIKNSMEYWAKEYANMDVKFEDPGNKRKKEETELLLNQAIDLVVAYEKVAEDEVDSYCVKNSDETDNWPVQNYLEKIQNYLEKKRKLESLMKE